MRSNTDLAIIIVVSFFFTARATAFFLDGREQSLGGLKAPFVGVHLFVDLALKAALRFPRHDCQTAFRHTLFFSSSRIVRLLVNRTPFVIISLGCSALVAEIQTFSWFEITVNSQSNSLKSACALIQNKF